MARQDFSPPTGFVIEDTPAQPQEAAQETTPPAVALPEGFEIEPPQMNTFTTKKGNKTITFQAPVDASDDDIRTLAAEAAGTPLYLRSAVVKPGQKPPEQPPEVGVAEAGWEGLKSLGLMGLGDEIQAAGGGLGRMLGGGSFSEGYDAELAAARGTRDAAWDQQPVAYGVGGAVGLVPGLALPGGRVAQIENWLPRTAALSGVGGAYGAATGAAGADQDRLEGALVGGTLGATLAPVLPPLLAAGGNLASRVGQRTGLSGAGRNVLNSLDALLTRAPQDAGLLADRVAARRDVGLEPVLADVIDEQGAGTMRALGQRDGARDTAVSWARGRRADLQDNVAAQAAPISPESRPVAAVVDDIRTRRTESANAEYEAIRNAPVPVTDNLRRVLDTGAGRRALRNAIETSDTPEEVAGFLSALRQNSEPSELDRVMGLLPEGMSDAAREQVRAQLVRQGVQAGEPLLTFTLDMLDRVKRDLQATMRSPDASGRSRQYQRMVNELVTAGDAAAPGYATARANFAADSGLMEAAEAGAGILRGNADEFVATARGLSDDTRVVTDPQGVETTLPSERDIARVGARRALELEAGEGPRRALGLADRMAYGRNALNRLEALVDEPTARRVQQGMEVTAQDARRANFLDPNAGSKTASLGADMADAGVDLALTAATGGKAALLRRGLQMLNNMGVRQVDADRLWSLATDPTQTDAAIDYLVRRGARRAEAVRVVNSLSARYPGIGAGDAYDDSTPVRRNDAPFIQRQ